MEVLVYIGLYVLFLGVLIGLIAAVAKFIYNIFHRK